jgi:hypothetical protein
VCELYLQLTSVVRVFAMLLRASIAMLFAVYEVLLLLVLLSLASATLPDRPASSERLWRR